EMLFRIKDACLHSDNAPEWEKLFVQGVANHLQGFSGYTPLTRERAEQLDAFMRDSTPSFGRFFGKMAQFDLQGSLAELFRSPEALHDYDAEVDEAEKVTATEQNWLDERIALSAGIDRYEAALLDFVAD
ncbi:MAG: hypothetical protein ACRCY3_13810, partial [Sphingorhabdus sp.]